MSKSLKILINIAYLISVICLGFFASSCEEEEVQVPENLSADITITAEEFATGNYDGLLVRIEGVQFQTEGEQFNPTNSNGTGSRIVEECATGNTFIVFTGADRAFARQTVPSGRGAIVGIASSFNDTPQLLLRGEQDWSEMTGERCTEPVTTVTVAEFNSGNFEGDLVQIEDVQFEDPDALFNGTSSNANGSRVVEECSTGNTFIVFTSRDSEFSNESVPDGRGILIGRASSFSGTPQLELRGASDWADLENTNRCANGGGEATLETIANVRALFSGSATSIASNIKIRGVVTSEKDNGSITDRNIYIQDASGAIVVRFTGDNTFALNEEIEIELQGRELSEFNELLQVNNVPNGDATSVSSSITITPTVVSIADILTGDYEAQLVQINNITYTDANGSETFNGAVEVSDGSNTITMFTRSGFSALAGTILPSGTVSSITVHASTFNAEQILPRSTSEVQ